MADPIIQDPVRTPAQPAPAQVPAPAAQKPADDAWLDAPIDVAKIMGTPTPTPAGQAEPDHSWLDKPISAPETQMTEAPSWFEQFGHGLKEGSLALVRGPANALAAGANLTNSAFRALPGIDGDTLGGAFGRAPDRPLGTSENIVPSLVEGVTQFAAGFALARPATAALGGIVKGAAIIRGAQGGLSLTGEAAAGMATDFAAFDARAGRVTDLIGRIPGLEGLDLTSQDDGEIEGRVKNALEGIGIGAAFGGVIRVVRWNRARNLAQAAGKSPVDAIAAADAAVPDLQKSLAEMYDMRTAEQSPFKGQLLDDAMVKAKAEPVFVNVDGSEATGFTVMEPGPKPSLRDMPNEATAAALDAGLKHEADVARKVLTRELGFDEPMVTAYMENVRKKADGGPEAASAASQVEAIKARLKPRAIKQLLEGQTLGEHSVEDLRAAIKYKESGWVERQQPRFISLAATPADVDAANKTSLTAWVNKHGTLLDNPQTTIKLGKDGTAEMGVTLRSDQWTPEAKKIAASVKAAPDMTPGELGIAAQNLTKSRQASPQGIEPATPVKPPDVPGVAGEAPAAIPAPTAPRITPHQIYMGELGFDAKTADQIGEILHGQFVEGVAERGQIKLKFEAKGEPFTDAVNPKRMSREDLLSAHLRKKGMNFEGLKGQPEVLAQGMRTLDNMYVALREAENPLLVKETFVDMTARSDSELSRITGIASSYNRSAYLKLAEKVGVEDANRIGAQAKAGVDFAAGIALDLQAKSVEMQARIAKNIPIQPWEYAVWAESRGQAKDALDMSSSLRNALARNLYMQRGEIKPAKDAVARLTATQLQQDEASLRRILMENGGQDKIMRDVELIALAGGKDLHDLAYVLQLSRGTHGLMSMGISAGYASMLSGFGTPISQIWGNLTVASLLPLERMWTGAIHVPFARDAAMKQAMKDEFAEGFGMYMSMFMHIPETMRAYKTGFMHGPTLNPRGGVFDVASRAKVQPFSAANAGVNLYSDEGLLLEAIGDLFSVPMRLLQGGDEMAKVMLHHSTVRARLGRDGMKMGKRGAELGAYVTNEMNQVVYKGQALSVDQLERRAVDQVQREGYTGIHAIERKNRLVAEWEKSDWYRKYNPLSEYGAQLGEEAAQSKPLDPRTVGGGFQKFFNRHPVLAFALAPFHKTGVNIAKFTLQRMDWPAYARWVAESKFNIKGSSYENTTNRFLADMRSGDPVRAARARGRVILGTTITGGVAAMYMSGMLTGRGPSDKKLRAQMMEAGWLPYAFRNPIDEKYYSYGRAEPMATILGLVSDVAQSLEEVPDDRTTDMVDIAMGVGTALAANLTNKSYAKGLADFTNAITSPAEYMENWLRSLSTRYVPNVVRDVENIVDPTFSEIRSIHDAMIAKIPYMSSGLEPRRNILGEPILRNKKLGEDTFGRFISPFSIVQVGKESDPLTQELASMEHAFSMPGSKRHGYDMLDIKAANGQTSFDRWLENTGTVPLGGKTLRQALEMRIASPSYQRLSSESVNGETPARASDLQSIVSRYRRAARLKTQREIPELNEAELQSQKAYPGVTIGGR